MQHAEAPTRHGPWQHLGTSRQISTYQRLKSYQSRWATGPHASSYMNNVLLNSCTRFTCFQVHSKAKSQCTAFSAHCHSCAHAAREGSPVHQSKSTYAESSIAWTGLAYFDCAEPCSMSIWTSLRALHASETWLSVTSKCVTNRRTLGPMLDNRMPLSARACFTSCIENKMSWWPRGEKRVQLSSLRI